MKSLAIFSLIVSTLIFSSCDETKKVIDVAGSVQLSGTYNITSVKGTKINTSGMSFSMAALDKSIRGNTGCNSFFGSYTIDLYTLQFGDIAVSERMCDQPLMNSERALMDALKNTGSYALQDGQLTLYSKADRSVLISAQKENNQGN